MNLQILLQTVAIGAFATLIMDIGALVGFRAGLAGHGPRRQGLEFIGRWIGYLMRGKIQHEDILLSHPLSGEERLGLIAHYATGIGLALVFVMVLSVIDTVPSIWVGLAYGTVSVILPWFLYFPAIGAGKMGRAVSPGMEMARASFLTHALYGLGLGLGSILFV